MFSCFANGENATVQVVDMMGRVIVSLNDANSISTQGISAGVYMLRLINGNVISTQKIIVE